MIIYVPMATTGQTLGPPLNGYSYNVMAGPYTTAGHEGYVAQSGAFVVDGTRGPNHNYGTPFPSGHSNIANTAVQMGMQGALLDKLMPLYNAKQCTWL
jgi:hypothetical protein